MSEADFDIDALAAYLHLTPQQVARLADRDKLPGRKVAGAWRFSRAEIHHWLEDRIGVSDDDELARMEDALDRHSGGQWEDVSISEMLSIEAIAVPLAARTRGKVITAMVELATETGLLWDPPKMAEAVRAREDLYPTAVDGGVALMHPRRPMSNILGGALIALGRTETGIPFSSAGLTDLFFLICSLDDRGHLRTLARLSRILSEPQTLDDLRAAPDAAAVHRIIADREADVADT